jgi:plasmid stabilization system protein ParE
MQINYSPEFQFKLKQIQRYIAQDKIIASRKFVSDLKLQCENLVNFPFKYRKSYYFNNENIRDMNYKGYTIIYEIDETSIEIQTIFNQNLPILKKEN